MTSTNKYSRIRTKNRRSRLTALTVIWFLWDVKELTPHCSKKVSGQPSHINHIVGWVGSVTGALVCWRPSLLWTYEIYILMRALLLSSYASLLPSFFHLMTPLSLVFFRSLPRILANRIDSFWSQCTPEAGFGEYHVKLWDGTKLIRFAESATSISYCILLAKRINRPDPGWDKKVRYCSLF